MGKGKKGFRPLTRFLIINIRIQLDLSQIVIEFPSPYEVPNYKLKKYIILTVLVIVSVPLRGS